MRLRSLSLKRKGQERRNLCPLWSWEEKNPFSPLETLSSFSISGQPEGPKRTEKEEKRVRQEISPRALSLPLSLFPRVFRFPPFAKLPHCRRKRSFCASRFCPPLLLMLSLPLPNQERTLFPLIPSSSSPLPVCLMLLDFMKEKQNFRGRKVRRRLGEEEGTPR